MPTTFVSYIRVSTQRQSGTGLGMDAQRVAVASYVRDRGEVHQEFVEVESGRKSGRNRPQLLLALAACKRAGHSLVIGKLDRLARDVRFFLEVMDDSGVDIRFADLPDVNPKSDEGRMILINMANFAEFEGRRIGTRTRAALAAAKARGTKLGIAGTQNLRASTTERIAAANAYAAKMRDVIGGLQAQKLSQRRMVEALNSAAVPTPAGKARWNLCQLQRLIIRIANVQPGSP